LDLDITPFDIPLAQWVETFVDYLSANFSAFFGAIADIILYLYNAVNWLFQTPPSLLIILVFALLAWRLKGWGFALFSALSLWFLDILGLWSHTMSTLSLVIAAVLVAVVIGLPTGIAAAFYINVYFFDYFLTPINSQVDKILKRVQGFTPSTNENAQIVPFKVNINFMFIFGNSYAHLYTHSFKDLFQQPNSFI
jgi:ABC-type proline/glycine betaine transport system permease subunit